MIYLSKTTEPQAFAIPIATLQDIPAEVSAWSLTLSSTIGKKSFGVQPTDVARNGRYLVVSVTLPDLVAGEYYAVLRADDTAIAGCLAVVGSYRRQQEEFSEQSITIEQYER